MKAVASILIVIWLGTILLAQNASSFTTSSFPSNQCTQQQLPSCSFPIRKNTSRRQIITRSRSILYSWFFQNKDEDIENDAAKEFIGQTAKEAEMMQRTAKMMEDHRRSQEAAERTAAIMDELSSTQVVGKSKAGSSGGISIGGGDRKGGVKVTYNGQQEPTGVEVDPNFLFSSSSTSESQGVISVEDLNDAIMDAMEDGYAKSGNLMEEKIKDLYGQLGLQREPAPLKDEQGGGKK